MSMDILEVKACLRALLTSSPLSYTLRALLNDFRNTTGFDLPLFGYKDSVEFLTTLTDTIQLIGNPYNPLVALVESEKSSHITSLVDRQRNKKLNISSSRTKALPPRLIMSLVQDPASNLGNAYNVEGNYFPHTQSSSRFLQKTDYRQRGSNPINSAGYNSFKKNYVNSPMNPKNHPKYELSPTQPPRAVTRKDQQHQNYYQGPPVFLESETYSKSLPNEFPDFLDPLPMAGRQPGSICVAPNSQETEKTDSCYFEDFSDIDSFLSGETGISPPLKTDPVSFIYINEKMKAKLKQVIKKFPDGLWCCELPNSFFKEFSDVLDYREFGCTSLIEMLSELPDVFRCIRPGSEDWILFDASSPPSPKEKKLMKLQENRNMASEIASNLQKLLSNHCEEATEAGVELSEIPYLYKMMFETPLDFKSMGFSNLRSLLETYEGSLLNICESDNKTMVLPIVKKDALTLLPWKEALPPITKDNDIFKEIFPEEVVGPEGSYPELDLSLHIAVGQRIEVCVAEVWSPGEFCLQLNTFKNKWTRFAFDLQSFYNTHLHKYKMPDATIMPNQLCVGLYSEDPENPDEWNRAKILKVINERTVMVEFVDYGTVARVKKTQLRFLHRCFQSLPVQAFLAELYNLTPIYGDTWSMKASKRFLELSQVPYLEAELKDVDFKKRLLKVVLYDPSCKPHLNINKRLISENLARTRRIKEKISASDVEELVKQKNEIPEAVNENTFNVASDEFSDASDLECQGYTAWFRFKMKSPKALDSKRSSENEASEETKKIVEEFEEVPDWDKIDEESEGEAITIKEKPEERDLFEVKDDSPLRKSNPKTADAMKPQERNLLEGTTRRLPPGLEHMAELNRFGMLPVEQPVEIKKKINILSVELLTTNPSIKQVAVQDPTLALKIASEMAEVYVRWMCCDINPFRRNHFPGAVMAEPQFLVPLSMPFPEVFPPVVCASSAPAPAEIEPKKESKTTGSVNVSSDSDKDRPIPFSEGNQKCVRMETVGGKNVHVVIFNGQFYFLAEELIRTFSTFANRDVADRVLHLKKVVVEYKILNKRNGKKVLTEIKSLDIPGIFKKKSKKWNVYLITAGTAAKFLQGLGCETEELGNDLIRFEKPSWEDEDEEGKQWKNNKGTKTAAS